MGHILYLKPESTMVEILPPWFPMFAFRGVAQVLGVQYFSGRTLRYEQWNEAVNDVPLPDGWTPPQNQDGWQEAEWAYVTEDHFLSLIDAAVTSQLHRMHQ
jgi:hypothetical protein